MIATASRPETREWVKALGAGVILNHRNDLKEEAAQGGVANVGAAVSMHGTDQHSAALAEIIKPQGKLALVTSDMESQHKLLNEVADLVDAKRIQGTLRNKLGPLTFEKLRETHTQILMSKSVGKAVIDGVELGQA